MPKVTQLVSSTGIGILTWAVRLQVQDLEYIVFFLVMNLGGLVFKEKNKINLPFPQTSNLTLTASS